MIIPESKFAAYFLYYLAKCSFSFRALTHKNHLEERGCPYDQKINKLAIIESMRARALCAQCRTKLRAEPLLTAKQVLALESLFAACGDLLKQDSKDAVTVDPRPSAFIGSSSEGLAIAKKLAKALSNELIIDVWKKVRSSALVKPRSSRSKQRY